MALNVKQVIDPEAVREESNGSIQKAMGQWASRVEVVLLYNEWQGAFFLLLREGFVDEEKLEGENPSERQARMKASHARWMESLHGSSWRDEGAVRQTAKEREVFETESSAGSRAGSRATTPLPAPSAAVG